MTAISVELSGEDVNKAIADAIVKSILGDAIVKMVNEYVKTLSNHYDSPLKKVVEQVVKDEITRLVLAKAPEIKEAVEKQMAEGVVDKVITASLEKLLKIY